MDGFEQPEARKFADWYELWEFYEAGNVCRLVWTKHAKTRVMEMLGQGLVIDDLISAYLEPVHVGWSDKYLAVIPTCGDVALSVCIAPDGTPHVATVLWSNQAAWRRSYEKRVEGRAPRYNLSHLPSLFAAA